VTVTVAEMLGRHRAQVPDDAGVADCCEAGHADAEEAAGHAWKLTRALARREAERLAVGLPARPSAA
jgi:hypothetical protein